MTTRETSNDCSSIRPLLPDSPTASDVQRLTRFLEAHGTFHFPTLPNGLFSAAAGAGSDFEQSGYHNVWVRDNVHIANAHLVIGQPDVAVRTVSALMQFFTAHRRRFDDVISGRADASDPMQRPHVRFHGPTLTELNEKWAHAQNDALGLLLWLICRLIQRNHLQPGRETWNVLGDLVHYFRAIEFWRDEDSGHWEESRKVSASSIGIVTSGLTELRRVLDVESAARAAARADRPVDPRLIDELIANGRRALDQILPAECVQTDAAKRREHDAALLFLIFPCEIVEGELAGRIVSKVVDQLAGPHGVRRYRGDSYWCANYKQLLSADRRSADVSDSQAGRDSLLRAGEEAQWCLFDPILSTIFGTWHSQTGIAEFRARQIHHLRRSLSQLTPADSGFGPFRCPESYYLEAGKYVPNDMTPLLWTQANLRVALHWLERTSPAGKSLDNFGQGMYSQAKPAN